MKTTGYHCTQCKHFIHGFETKVVLGRLIDTAGVPPDTPYEQEEVVAVWCKDCAEKFSCDDLIGLLTSIHPAEDFDLMEPEKDSAGVCCHCLGHYFKGDKFGIVFRNGKEKGYAGEVYMNESSECVAMWCAKCNTMLDNEILQDLLKESANRTSAQTNMSVRVQIAAKMKSCYNGN